MTEEMNDDELQGLLSQLDEKDDFVVDTMKSESEVGHSCPKGEKGEIGEPGNNGEDSQEAVESKLVVNDVRKFENKSPDEVQLSDEEPIVGIQITKYLDKLDDVTDEVLAACRSDRQEAQEVIGIYKKAIEDAVSISKPPARMWVDGLVKAVEVKAGINANAVKMIEANAKMLAATKAGSTLNQQINIGGDNLDDVLSQELNEQDDY
jgi:hypothetical protein